MASASRVLALWTRGVLDELDPAWRDEPVRLARFGLLAPEALCGADTLIPHEDMVAVWRGLAAEHDPRFGLAYAERSAERSIGLLVYAAAHADDLGGAIRALVQLQRLADTHNAVALVEDGMVAVVSHRPPAEIGAWPAALAEAVIGAAVHLSRAFVGGELVLDHVTFQHRDPGTETAAWFGCPVHYEASANTIVLPRAQLARPLRSADRTMYASIFAAGVRQLEAVPGEDPLLESARRVLRERLGERMSVAELADALAMSPRTLQRRLAELGVTFRKLIDDVRLEVLGALSRPEKQLATAGKLGYADPASVRRLKRRTGNP